MNSPASGSESSGFGLLDSRIQRWIWTEGWTTLRDAQEQAIPALIEADQDVIIAAATAAGKTEAAFFPILTHVLRHEPGMGSVLYISPLKALINDQWDRLTDLCESLEIPVVAWHGDIAASKKQKFLKKPQGVLLITPESLEALFVNRGTSIPGLFANLQYIVVDELHAFIGVERGKQLQSLMHRVELAAGRTVPRVGLSATLGDMGLAAGFLRPKAPDAVRMIVSRSGGQELKVLLKGYVAPAVAPPVAGQDTSEDAASGCQRAIAAHLYKVLRNSNNLVFPNSRGLVEIYADHLRRLCEQDGAPNVFWPHHGNLAKEIREETEQALKDGTRPATAICTTTLELGIDIGAVKSIAQIGPPPSVASLRQRLGRSGRRKGEPAILRGYCIEPEITSKSGFSDRIHEGLLQSIAMTRLLMDGWFEPPRTSGLHASTLVQQILSVIAEKGGVAAATLWNTLVATGPFGNIEREDFIALLRHLGERGLITQESSGLLLHGELGEKLVNHYEFYSAFVSDDEYRLECNGKLLGSMPLNKPVIPQQGLIFAGRRWRVLDIDQEAKRIVVMPDKGGAPPAFDGGGAYVHDRVRQEMRAVLCGTDPVPFLDETGQGLLQEARDYFTSAGLGSVALLESGNTVLLLTWSGDWVNNTLALMLGRQGLQASNEGVAVTIRGVTPGQLREVIQNLLTRGPASPTALLVEAKNLEREKWDWTLPQEVLMKSYASSWLEPEAAFETLGVQSRTIAHALFE